MLSKPKMTRKDLLDKEKDHDGDPILQPTVKRRKAARLLGTY